MTNLKLFTILKEPLSAESNFMVEVHGIAHQQGFSTDIIPAAVQLSSHRLSFSSSKDTGGMEELVINNLRVNKPFHLILQQLGKNDYELQETKGNQRQFKSLFYLLHSE